MGLTCVTQHTMEWTRVPLAADPPSADPLPLVFHLLEGFHLITVHPETTHCPFGLFFSVITRASFHRAHFMDVSMSLYIDFLYGLILEDASVLLNIAQVRLRPPGPPEQSRPQVTCPLADGPGRLQAPFAGCEPTCEVPRALVSEQCNCWVPGKHASSRQSILAPV